MPSTALITKNSTAKLDKMPDLPKLILGGEKWQYIHNIVYIEITVTILVQPIAG